jgi:hypothetical protein
MIFFLLFVQLVMFGLWFYFVKKCKNTSIHEILLWICCFSLVCKSFGHVWLPDGAGQSHGGFDYSKGNANVITTILFLYGEVQYVWLFWNFMFLIYDQKWVKVALRVHFVCALSTVIITQFLWKYIKGFIGLK